MKSRSLAAVSVAALTLAGLTACASDDGTASTVDPSTCMNTIRVADVPIVTIWAWFPAFEEVIDLFNDAHDDMQACWTNSADSPAVYDQFSTTIEAGTGAPDVVMLEGEVLSTFVLKNALVDLTAYGASDVQENYSEGAWGDVTVGDGVYAIPVDGGPMGMMYRKDILDRYGIAVPTTWAEFEEAAYALSATDYDGYITNFPTNGQGYVQGLLQQAGTSTFTWDAANPEDIGIDFDSDSTVAVLEYWQKLIDAGAVSTDDSFTTDWGTNLARGTYAINIAAAWAPGYMETLDDLDESAQWAVAPIPQWEEGEDIQVNYGGSTFAVTAQSSQPELAATLVKEIYGSEEAWVIGIEQGALFPLWLPILESDYYIGFEDPFFDGQKANAEVWIPAAQKYAGTTYGPFTSVLYEKVAERLYDSMVEGSTSTAEAVELIQQDLVSYATLQGFSVNE